jgi:hypothetical protein
MKKIDKVYVVFDDLDEPCMVAPTKSEAQSYVNWFLNKNKKYYIDYFLVDSLKMNQEQIETMLKEFST